MNNISGYISPTTYQTSCGGYIQPYLLRKKITVNKKKKKKKPKKSPKKTRRF